MCVLYGKVLLEETREVLDGIDGVTSVHARFYDLSSHYHQVRCGLARSGSELCAQPFHH